MISNNNNMLSYVIRREERLALKECSLTADKKRSRFEPTINLNQPRFPDEVSPFSRTKDEHYDGIRMWPRGLTSERNDCLWQRSNSATFLS